MSARNGCAGLLLLALSVAALSAWWIRDELSTPYYGAAEPETFVEIPRGATTSRIARILAEAGVIRHSLPFSTYLRWKGLGRQLQAGEYRFVAAATPVEVAARLARGDVFYHRVTIPEGFDLREVAAAVGAAGLGDSRGLEEAFKRVEWIRDLAPEARDLEGYLFPDTYRFARNATASEIARTMVERFRARFAALSRRHPRPDTWSVHQVVTLASMIEREVRVPGEGPLVASVMVNRLALRMPLACDPTVIYALKLRGAWDGNIRKSDLSLDSPYNTYLRPGLPPGPIANPGERALESALAPAETDYLYFVSRNDGTHLFSRDYRAHQAAVERFQKGLLR